jgi:hypothetical protein
MCFFDKNLEYIYLILYICYGLFYCSYFSDAEDCIILAGIPLLFKEKPKNVLIWGQDQKDYPMSMNTDIFQVFVEERPSELLDSP